MKKIIAANWKMSGSKDFIKKYFNYFEKNIKNTSRNNIIIFPSYPHLAEVNSYKKINKSFELGAQHCHHNNEVAQTSYVSAAMLKDIGCNFVLVGHSEWRSLNNQDNLSEILESVIKNNMTPIFCIGENYSQKENSKTQSVIDNQLQNILDNKILFENCKIIIAYEPVWAIGTGTIPDINIIEFIHSYIKSKLAQKLSSVQEKDIIVLYGGSVSTKNIKEIFSAKSVDGVLIGGASLDVEEFTKICNEKL